MAYGFKSGGGTRKGIRNKSTEEVKDILEREVDFGAVVAKLFELSQGVEVEKYVNKEAVIYSEKPDPYAAKILLEYRYGKPVQTVHQTTIVTEIQKFKIGDQEITFE